jgi:hypothetical protein
MINYLLFQVIQLIREYVRFFLTSAIAPARLNDNKIIALTHPF